MVCYMENDNRVCILFDEASNSYMEYESKYKTWFVNDKPPVWFDLVEEGNADVTVEWIPQYWEGEEKAYMYDEDLKEWLVRATITKDGVELLCWFPKSQDSIPDWVWKSSHLDKNDHKDVAGDDGTRFDRYCSTMCPDFFPGDGYCDTDCQNKACQLDGGDCETGTVNFCADGCHPTYIGDGECDTACDNEACSHDKGDCV